MKFSLFSYAIGAIATMLMMAIPVYKNLVNKIELPEEIGLAVKGDTLTYEVIDKVAVIGFYHGYANQRNKRLIVVQ